MNLGPVFISIAGTRGFTFDSGLSRQDGVFEASGFLKPPGSTISLGGYWVGTGFLGAIATLEGKSIPSITSGDNAMHIGGMGIKDPRADFRLEGLAGVLPFEGDTYTVTAPFTFSRPSYPLSG